MSDTARVRARRRRGARLLVAVAAGGALGTWARDETVLALPVAAGGFPWAIFWVNVAGSFILGVTMTLVLERLPPTRYVRPVVAIGFCGGLTTFSTWMVDMVTLADRGHTGTAVLDLAVSLVAGLASLVAGVWATRLLIREGSRP